MFIKVAPSVEITTQFSATVLFGCTMHESLGTSEIRDPRWI